MNQRYSRQEQVKQLQGQADKLAQTKVLVVGLGGLGSIVSQQLAGAGIGKLTLIDGDEVSLSNLHRQTLYTEHDIGKAKAVIAEQRLMSINSEIDITAISHHLNTDNAETFVSSATIVVDAADNFLATYLLSDLCHQLRIPLVSASVINTQGYIGVFCGTAQKPAPSVRAIFPVPPSSAATCDTVGVTGPSVSIIGSLQAQEVLKVSVGDNSQLLGKLLHFNLWDYRQNCIDFSNAPEPASIANIVSKQSLQADDILLDLRMPEEVQQDPHENVSHHIPLNELSQRHTELLQEPSQKLSKQQRIVCICKSGQRALSGASQLIELGFKNVAVTTA